MVRSVKVKITHYIIAFLIVVIGIGGIVAYDFWLRPMVFSQSVVTVRSGISVLPEGSVIRESDVQLKSVDADVVPSGALRSISDAVGKTLRTDLTGGTILIGAFVGDGYLTLGPDEGVFPIPKAGIYSVNGTLRSGDTVNIYVMAKDGGVAPRQSAFENVLVAYARSDDNNDVQDSVDGNVNRRITSTANVSSVELKMNTSDGERLLQYLNQGYKLAIVRVR